jgi:hypothetical protein
MTRCTSKIAALFFSIVRSINLEAVASLAIKKNIFRAAPYQKIKEFVALFQ